MNERELKHRTKLKAKNGKAKMKNISVFSLVSYLFPKLPPKEFFTPLDIGLINNKKNKIILSNGVKPRFGKLSLDNQPYESSHTRKIERRLRKGNKSSIFNIQYSIKNGSKDCRAVV